MDALSKTSIPGSLASQAANSGQSIAQTFVGADVIVLVDTSSSMSGLVMNWRKYKPAYPAKSPC